MSELTISESAVIAATTSNPYKYNPVRFPENNKTRRAIVLKNMLDQELISKAEYDEALADNVYDRIMNVKNTSTGSTAYSYYTDALISQLMQDLMNLKC